MPKIYFYKLTSDSNGAPCVHNGLLSLAICKPMIRSTAAVGDIVIGFAANSLHADNRLIYVARVTDKLTNSDYFTNTKFSGRPDCIYAWREGRFVVRAGALYHGSPSDLIHDLGEHAAYPRANTLLSRKFRYFGASGTDDYKKAFPVVAEAVAALGQGHRVYHDAKLLAELERLAKWSCALNSACVRGEATSKPQCGISLRGGGCGVAHPKGVC